MVGRAEVVVLFAKTLVVGLPVNCPLVVDVVSQRT